MDYRLEGLSWREFEHVVQAIALKQVGPSTVVFGDGPDGGREAVYDGRIAWLGGGDWEGRLVIQAKFRQHSRGSADDGRWALRQLEAELDEYRRADGSRDLPDYYLLATNAQLTAAANTGSKDKLLAKLDAAVEEGLFRGYDVWDRDKICRFIDLDADLRHAYAAWITPGDVLATMAEQLELGTPSFDRTLSLFLQKELLADQYANLEQAGSVSEERVPIARVFVDLPLWAPGRDDEEGPRRGFVEDLLAVASKRLHHIPGRLHTSKRALRAPHPDCRRVLVGGPGQGKTTVGQFACQLFRATILRDRPADTLSLEATRALDLIAQHCQQSGIPLPSARRFPLRVVLSEFATALQKANGALSLLRFLVDRVEAAVDREVPVDVFRSWLGGYPWLIVLDGLDEVPVSSNRDEVMEAIENFWVDVADSKADLLVLATTRPQGYNDDFAPDVYQHQYLAPLRPDEAMGYARQLVGARRASEPDRCDRTLARLERAAASEATARLMSSPLQVTIMAALVDQVGSPPEQRWNLFSDYYRVIYNREVERDIPAAEILRRHKPNIDSIHRRLALVLQRESEVAKNTEAHLTRERFAGIVEGRLRDEAHEGAELERLRDEILGAAVERLVFVVGLEDDRVGFEIRSLQEFMAAEALMDGSEVVVGSRLRAIAQASAWRNVFLFAAGRCFADRQYLRDTIHGICAELNDVADDSLVTTAKLGASIALDVLGDGVVENQPHYRGLLLRQALRMADRPATSAHDDLVAHYEAGAADAYREALENALARRRPRSGAWRMLSGLIDRDVGWARELLLERWPHDPSVERELIAELVGVHDLDEALLQALGEAALRHDPADIFLPARLHVSLASLEAPWSPLFMEPVREVVGVELADVPGEEAPVPLLAFVSVDVEPSGSSDELGAPVGPSCDGIHEHWRLREAAERFFDEPTPDRLADVVEQFADSRPLDNADWADLPWPLRTCLSAIWDGADGATIAAAARSGDLGDHDDWIAAEHRWRHDGLRRADLEYRPAGDLPFDAEIARVGVPLAGVAHSVDSAEQAMRAIDWWLTMAPTAVARRNLAGWAMQMARVLPHDLSFPLSPESFERLARLAFSPDGGSTEQRQTFDLDLVGAIAASADRDAIADVLDLYGSLAPSWSSHRSALPAAGLIEGALQVRPDGEGLWRLMAAAAISQAPHWHVPESWRGSQVLGSVCEISPQAGCLLELALMDQPAPELSRILDAVAQEPAWLRLFEMALAQATVDDGNVALLLEADARAGDPGNVADNVLGRLVDGALLRCQSALQDPVVWAELELFAVPA